MRERGGEENGMKKRRDGRGVVGVWRGGGCGWAVSRRDAASSFIFEQ